MDPLTITVSVITLISAAHKTSVHLCSLAKGISSKSEEIQSILNELQDLQVVLSSAEVMIRGGQGEPWQLDSASPFPVLLRRLQDKLASVESFLRDYISNSSGKANQFIALDWAIHGRDKARRLKDDIRSLKWNLGLSINAIAASSTLDVSITLSKVQLELQDLRSGVKVAESISIENHKTTLEATNQLEKSGEALMKHLEQQIDGIKEDISENSTNMFLRGQLNSLLPPSAVAMHLSLQQRIMLQRSSTNGEEMHKGMKMLFENGLASPFDVSSQTGDQPLHITADHGFLQASRLLVAYGADPHEHDMERRNTPHSNAWGTILSGTVSPKIKNQLAALFVNVHVSYDFPRLSEHVLGLRPQNLERELENPECEIDARDSFGNTALLWACRRGDEASARILIESGANLDIPNSNYGCTPLMAACAHPSMPIIRLLLQKGADVNVRSRYGLDALIYLVEEDRDPQPIDHIVEATKLLIAHGISLQPHEPNNVWCVSRAARNGLIEAMALMLDYGADVDSFCLGDFRTTALARSITWGVPTAVEFLLKRGASYTGTVGADLHNRTILHHAAMNPSLDVLKVLINANLSGLDPDDVDNDGLTAEDCLEAHKELKDGVYPAFKHLVADLKQRLYSDCVAYQEVPYQKHINSINIV